MTEYNLYLCHDEVVLSSTFLTLRWWCIYVIVEIFEFIFKFYNKCTQTVCVLLACGPVPIGGYQNSQSATCIPTCAEYWKGDSTVRGTVMYKSCESK